MLNSNDTIVAIATPPGRGGVGIIRLSGNGCQVIAKKILGHLPVPRQANFTSFNGKNGEVLDQGIALFFKAPNSFTGEDVLELQAHGGPIILDLILQYCVDLGARIARPGEFSERAFLNDKLDLAQAEAIADLIDASSEQAARAAVRSLQGEFSVRVNSLLKSLIELRMYIEAAIDFPEEEIDFLSDGKLIAKFDQLQSDFIWLKESTRQGTLLHEGISIVIAGRPNAGKSSLLNVLAGRESAIVTDVAGTTRDVLREQIQLNGLPLHVIDTAGLRQTDDPVELMGIKRAWTEIEKADRVLLLIDDRQGITAEDQEILNQLPKRLALTIIRNKCDLSGAPAALIDEEPTVIRMSVKDHTGIEILKTHLKDCVGFQSSGEGEFIARRRHLDALTRTGQHIVQAREQLEVAKAGELAAEELREAQQHLAEITGEFSSDDLLGTIFSSFCIGK